MSNTPTHGSDVQETPDWWKASDGRFYPPELHPDYKAPAAPPPAAPAPAAAAPTTPPVRDTPSLAERLREAGGKVGSDSADGGAGEAVRDTATGARGTLDDAAGGAAAAAASAAAASTPPVVDPRATMPASPPGTPATPPVQQTVIQQQPGAPAVQPAVPPSPGSPPAMPPSPGSPPAMPPSPGAAPAMPPSPGAAPAMPPSPGAAPAMPPSPGAAPSVEQGPGGITYTAAPDTGPSNLSFGAVGEPSAPGSPPAPTSPPAAAPMYQQSDVAAIAGPAKAASGTAGLVAVLAGAAAIAGSLLQWGKGAVTGSDGVEKAIIEVAGFDSNGLITAIAGGVLVLCGILFFMGVPQQLYWAIAAFISGGAIVGAVVFSMIDIGDLSNRYAAEWQANGLAAVGDVISTQADLGLWVAGAGGVLGVLSAPFVNRN